MAEIIGNNCYSLSVSIQSISDIDTSLLNFSCGNKSIDSYLKEQAKEDTKNVTHVFFDEDNRQPIAFVSLKASGLIFESSAHLEIYPAVEISYFATDERYQHVVIKNFSDIDRYCISDHIFSEIIKHIREIADFIVGAEFVVLYSVPDAVHFYERNFFETMPEIFRPEKYLNIDGCVPMVFKL